MGAIQSSINQTLAVGATAAKLGEKLSDAGKQSPEAAANKKISLGQLKETSLKTQGEIEDLNKALEHKGKVFSNMESGMTKKSSKTIEKYKEAMSMMSELIEAKKLTLGGYQEKIKALEGGNNG